MIFINSPRVYPITRDPLYYCNQNVYQWQTGPFGNTTIFCSFLGSLFERLWLQLCSMSVSFINFKPFCSHHFCLKVPLWNGQIWPAKCLDQAKEMKYFSENPKTTNKTCINILFLSMSFYMKNLFNLTLAFDEYLHCFVNKLTWYVHIVHPSNSYYCRPGRECRSDGAGEPRCVCRAKCPDHWKPVSF